MEIQTQPEMIVSQTGEHFKLLKDSNRYNRDGNNKRICNNSYQRTTYINDKRRFPS